MRPRIIHLLVSLRALRTLLLAAGLCNLVCRPLSAIDLADEWRYTLDAPEDDWTQTDYDDSGWKKGPGGFGTRGTPSGRIGTQWSTPNIWLRRAFTLDTVPPENAWREYPRPQMKRGPFMCLNGLWDFALVGDAQRWTGGRIENAVLDPLLGELPPLPTDWPHKILVPFSPETQLSGIIKSVRPNQVMWYRRDI